MPSFAVFDPDPPPVAVTVGPHTVYALGLRLKDLWALERYVAATVGSPLDGLDPAASDYPEQLRAAYDLAEDWPPSVASEAGRLALFSDPAGLAFYLSILLRRMPNPDLAAIALAVLDDPLALARLDAVAWGVPPSYRAEVVRRIDAHLGIAPFEPAPHEQVGAPITWSKAFAEAVEAYPWASPDVLARMPLTAWRMLRCGGEPDPETDDVPADEALRETVLAARAAFFGGPVGRPAPPEPEGAAGGVASDWEEAW